MGLLPMACSACFLIEPRTISSGVAQPATHQSPIEKMPFCLQRSVRRIFSLEAPSSQITGLGRAVVQRASTPVSTVFVSASRWTVSHHLSVS